MHSNLRSFIPLPYFNQTDLFCPWSLPQPKGSVTLFLRIRCMQGKVTSRKQSQNSLFCALSKAQSNSLKLKIYSLHIYNICFAFWLPRMLNILFSLCLFLPSLEGDDSNDQQRFLEDKQEICSSEEVEKSRFSV